MTPEERGRLQERLGDLQWLKQDADPEKVDIPRLDAEIAKVSAELDRGKVWDDSGSQPPEVASSEEEEPGLLAKAGSAWSDFVAETLDIDWEDPSAASQMLAGAGRTIDSYSTGLQQIYHDWMGNTGKVQELERKVASENDLWEAFDEKYIWDDIGEIVPELAAGGLAGISVKGGVMLGALAAGLRGQADNDARLSAAASGAAFGGAGAGIWRMMPIVGMKAAQRMQGETVLDLYNRAPTLSVEGLKDMAMSLGGKATRLIGRGDAGRIAMSGARKLGKTIRQSDELMKLIGSREGRAHELHLRDVDLKLKQLRAGRQQMLEDIQIQAYDKLGEVINRLTRHGQSGVGGQLLLDNLELAGKKATRFNDAGVPMINTARFVKEMGIFNRTRARKDYGATWADVIGDLQTFMETAPRQLMPLDEVIQATRTFLQQGANPNAAKVKGEAFKMLASRAWGNLGAVAGVGAERDGLSDTIDAWNNL